MLHETHEEEQEPKFDRFRGVVKWFDAKKGYGFIVIQDVSGETSSAYVGADAFVHYTDVLRDRPDQFQSLNDGETVTFSHVTTEPKGIQARGVRRYRNAPAGHVGQKTRPHRGNLTPQALTRDTLEKL